MMLLARTLRYGVLLAWRSPALLHLGSMKPPDLVYSVKPEPYNEVPKGSSSTQRNFWDHADLQPEGAPACLVANRYAADDGVQRLT
jgi:hypothetical protein